MLYTPWAIERLSRTQHPEGRDYSFLCLSTLFVYKSPLIHPPPPISYLKSENSLWFQIALFYLLPRIVVNLVPFTWNFTCCIDCPSEIIKFRRHAGWWSSFRLLGTNWWEEVVFSGFSEPKKSKSLWRNKALIATVVLYCFQSLNDTAFTEVICWAMSWPLTTFHD